jgi:hypothetical protein
MSDVTAESVDSQSTVDQVRDGMQGAASQIQEQAQDVRGKAREQLTQQLTTRSSDAGEQVRSLADAFRRTGHQLRGEGNDQPAEVIDQIATRGESLARYLEEANGDRMLRDLEGFGRRQPWLFTGGALIAGFFASRFLKASSTRRYEQNGSMNGMTRSQQLPPPSYDRGGAMGGGDVGGY